MLHTPVQKFQVRASEFSNPALQHTMSSPKTTLYYHESSKLKRGRQTARPPQPRCNPKKRHVHAQTIHLVGPSMRLAKTARYCKSYTFRLHKIAGTRHSSFPNYSKSRILSDLKKLLI